MLKVLEQILKFNNFKIHKTKEKGNKISCLYGPG